MSIYLSPGIYSKEVDLSNIITNLSTTSAAIVGASPKGDTSKIRLITNTQQFINQYGQPVLGNGFHYAALAYLENGNQLWALRVANGALYGSVKIRYNSNPNVVNTIGQASPDFVAISGELNLFYIYGINPGAWTENIGIQIQNIVMGVGSNPNTFDIVVYTKDLDGNVTEVERWNVSRQHGLDGYGNQIYLETKINGFSSYILVADSTVDEGNVPTPQASTLYMGAGDDGSPAGDAEFEAGWQQFINPDVVDIRILIGAGQTSFAVQNAIKGVAESRKDCIAILDTPLYTGIADDVTQSILTFRNTTTNWNSSYAAMYAPWVQIYDQYNATLVYVPPSGFVASQFAYNDYQANVWDAPAGLNRGIPNVLALSTIFSQGNRDVLYAAQVNPIQTFPGQGNPIWGQKTQQSKSSALSRINVRRMLITMEKALTIALKYFVFEPNNDTTRFRVTAMLEQYLDQMAAGGAFQQTAVDPKGYKVVCDLTNNTPQTIDNNELHVDVFVKPIRTAEFIQLQTIVTSTGTAFAELIAQGVNL
jgi:hypothetical protein